MPVEIYHITHLENLASILESDGLIAKSQLRIRQGHRDISHSGIQDRRAIKQVPLPPFGVLHDYVPFYFAPRSPMLYSNHKGNVMGYQGGQRPIVHLVSTVQHVAETDLPWVFTDGHAIMDYADFYDDLSQLDDVIDWPLMQSKYWFDTQENPNRCCRRQAEFLVHQFFPWSLFSKIGVIDEEIQQEVCQILQQFNSTTPVVQYRNWYY
jgi:hypothetical protein